MARKITGRLFKRKGRPDEWQTKFRHLNWYLEYQVNGKRFKPSLGVNDWDEAVRERDRILAPFWTTDQAEQRKAVAHALHDAEETMQAAAEAARKKLTLADSWQAFVKSSERPDSGEATLRQYSFQWDAFTAWLRDAHTDVEFLRDVTPAAATDYAEHLRERGLAAGTYNKHIALCRLVFRVLGEREGMAENPFAKTARRRDVQHHRRELAWDKLCEICDAAQGEMKTLLFLGIYTGQRLGHCCLLTWDEVDLRRGWIITVPKKTESRNGEPLHIPVLSHLRPLLEATPPEGRTGYLLPGLAELYLENRDKVTDRVQTLFRNCGVQIHRPGTGLQRKPDGEWYHTGVRAVLQYGFHSLRHTTVTLLQEAGVAQAVTQQIVGHRTVAMTQRYTHVGRQAIATAMRRLPAIGDTKALPPGAEPERARLHELADALPLAAVRSLLATADELTRDAEK